jgi:hypothetical protein
MLSRTLIGIRHGFATTDIVMTLRSHDGTLSTNLRGYFLKLELFCFLSMILVYYSLNHLLLLLLLIAEFDR